MEGQLNGKNACCSSTLNLQSLFFTKEVLFKTTVCEKDKATFVRFMRFTQGFLEDKEGQTLLKMMETLAHPNDVGFFKVRISEGQTNFSSADYYFVMNFADQNFSTKVQLEEHSKLSFKTPTQLFYRTVVFNSL